MTCHSMEHELMTNNKLLKSSMQLLTALVKRIIMQILVKLELRQSGLEISAGRLRFS